MTCWWMRFVSIWWCRWWSLLHHRQTLPHACPHTIPPLVLEDHKLISLLFDSFQTGIWGGSQSSSRHHIPDWPSYQYLVHMCHSAQPWSEIYIFQYLGSTKHVWTNTKNTDTTNTEYNYIFFIRANPYQRGPGWGAAAIEVYEQNLVDESKVYNSHNWKFLFTWGLCSVKAGKKEIASEVAMLTTMQMRRTVL